MKEQESSLIEQLIYAIHQQSQAIQALADSNQALVQAMADADGDEEEAPTMYLDGTRCL